MNDTAAARGRQAVLAAVRSIRPLDDLEERHLAETLAWIESGAEIWRRRKPDVPPRHLVSYLVLVDPARRHLLLVDHRNAGLWLPAGGHVEPDEDPRACAARELGEELDVEVEFLLPEPLFLTVTETVGATSGHTDVSLWYVLRGDASRLPSFDEGEFRRVAWFPLEALPLERADPHLGRFADKLRAASSSLR